MRHRRQIIAAQHPVVQTGICRTGRRTGEVGSRAGNDLLIDAIQPADLLSKFEPTGRTFAGQMADAAKFGMFQNYPHIFCHGKAAGRIADLIGNHLELRPGTIGKFQYGMDKTGTAGTVEPGDTADQCIRTQSEDQLFAEKFALAVNGFASGCQIALFVRFGGISVKDIIGGKGDQPHIVFETGSCHIGGTVGIDIVSENRFRFAEIDRRFGGTMDDNIRFAPANGTGYGVKIGDVSLGEVGDQYGMGGFQYLIQSSAEHTTTTGQHDIHNKYSNNLCDI